MITELKYYYSELASTLEQALISKLYEDLTDKAIGNLSVEYVANKYKEIYDAQTKGKTDAPEETKGGEA